jgi:hypothetical protein
METGRTGLFSCDSGQTGENRSGAPLATCHEQLAEITPGPKGAFDNLNIGTVTRRAAAASQDSLSISRITSQVLPALILSLYHCHGGHLRSLRGA